MSTEELTFFARHSAMSDPALHTPRVAALSVSPERTIDLVSGLVLHPGFVAALGVTPHPDSASDAEARSVRAIIHRIVGRDPRPLDVARSPGLRFIGICRDYAILACAIFRHHGVPARLRVGFASYFTPGFHEDHWVCEYYADGRWRLLDAELSPSVRAYYGIAFDPTDVPRDQFIVAGQAWQRYRRGDLDPSTCGVSTIGIAGARFIAGSVVRDLAALNKHEMLAWDYWGLARELRPGADIPPAAASRFDEIAAVANGDPPWSIIRAMYEHDEALRVPPTVLSFPRGVPVEVAVSV
jgi:hypothetical protein